MSKDNISLSFDNKYLPELLGPNDAHLRMLEDVLGIVASARGNEIYLSGKKSKVASAKIALEQLQHKIENNIDVGDGEFDALIRSSESKNVPTNFDGDENQDIVIKTRKRKISPITPSQKKYVQALLENDIVFASGPAGTGKTYLAVAVAVSLFIAGKIERLILSRPAVEAGENLGFLPGDLRDKVDPYLRPLYDALHDMLPADQVEKYLENGDIEIAPLAYMRGRTLKKSFVILDEAQNTTPVQMKMFLTRLGENARMVITGDLSQTDLPKNQKSGFRDAFEKLDNIPDIKLMKFDDKDVVRHPLVAKIIKAYEAEEQTSKWKPI